MVRLWESSCFMILIHFFIENSVVICFWIVEDVVNGYYSHCDRAEVWILIILFLMCRSIFITRQPTYSISWVISIYLKLYNCCNYYVSIYYQLNHKSLLLLQYLLIFVYCLNSLPQGF